MPWERLQSMSGLPVATTLADHGALYLLPTPTVGGLRESSWLVGGYKVLQPLAEELRQSQTLRDKVAACKVRLGLRDNDLPPGSPDSKNPTAPTWRGPGRARTAPPSGSLRSKKR